MYPLHETFSSSIGDSLINRESLTTHWTDSRNGFTFLTISTWKPICCFVAYRSNSFIVGLMDVSPTITPPTWRNYDVCGRYPGAVPAGATVSLKCSCSVSAHRYVIVQFPVNDHLNFCELEVFIRRKC